MSLCPTRDIHSVYLDNELPLSYVKEYEAHVQSCPACSAELEKLKKLRGMMALGEAPEMSQLEMDESFRRLQIRMSYSKHTKKSSIEKKPFVTAVKYTLPAMAAAAVFAVVLPVGLKSNKGAAGSDAAVASVHSEVNIPLTVSTMSSLSTTTVSMNGNNGMLGSGMHPGMPRSVMNENMTQVVDVFRPNFDNENAISFKITIPGINTVPYTTEMDVPVDKYKGNVSETD